MNINMKYYIVTIGSIFLALGIGIIVGFNLNYDQELSKQQSEVLSQFEEKFDSLNEEKSDLNKQIDSHHWTDARSLHQNHELPFVLQPW